MDKSGAATFFGGVDGRGGPGGLGSLGGCKILVDFLEECWTGRGGGGGERIRVELRVETFFSFGACSVCCSAEAERSGPFWRSGTGRSRSITDNGCVLLGVCFCFFDGRASASDGERSKSERKSATPRRRPVVDIQVKSHRSSVTQLLSSPHLTHHHTSSSGTTRPTQQWVIHSTLYPSMYVLHRATGKMTHISSNGAGYQRPLVKARLGFLWECIQGYAAMTPPREIPLRPLL